MAKANPDTPAAANAREDVQRLAERLFERNWKPNSNGTTPEAFSAMCFLGAQQFGRVASQIREGRSPDEILNPPDVTPPV